MKFTSGKIQGSQWLSGKEATCQGALAGHGRHFVGHRARGPGPASGSASCEPGQLEAEAGLQETGKTTKRSEKR